MELAVNIPEQDPTPGQAHPSASRSSSAADLANPRLTHIFEEGDEIDLASLELAGQHRPAADDDSRDVQPRRGHEHAGDDLVAVGDQDQAIEGVGHGHRFDRVGDQFAGAQRVFHPFVAHADPVADTDGEELEGRAAGHPYTRLDGVGDLMEVQVAGDQFVCRIGDADHRPFDFPVRQPQRFEQGAVRGPLQPFFHPVGTHHFPPSGTCPVWSAILKNGGSDETSLIFCRL